MAVPSKRKKIAETAEVLQNKAAKVQPMQSKATPAQARTQKSTAKIEHAFEIMDHMDRKTISKTPEKRKANTGRSQKNRPVSPLERFGFRFHFSIDAVIPEKNKAKKTDAPLLDIGLTVPFFWRMPIIGGITQKIIKRIKPLKL